MCRAKQALLRGMRPNSRQKINFHVCPTHCIFCNIWQLATIVSSHIPLHTRHGLQRHNTYPSSPASDTYDWESSTRMIEAQFQTQRARLSSIMSICTVEGAEDCEGLRIAHDKCLASIEDLLYQESILEQTLARQQHQHHHHHQQHHTLRSSRGRSIRQDYCGSNSYYMDQRRPSMAGMAM